MLITSKPLGFAANSYL